MQNKPVYIKPGKIPLSKEQQNFNRFVKRIEKLKTQLLSETDKLEQLNRLYSVEVYPNVLEQAKLKIQLCHLLHNKRQEIKLSASQNKKLDDLLFDFLDDAFGVVEPDDATKDLYSKYSSSNYEEELLNQEQAMQEELRDMLYNRFGLKLDPSLLTGSPDFDKIEEELKKQWQQKESGKKAKPKTKKQLAKEELETQKAALKHKNIRSIYIALAKILHPDTEQNVTLKMEKEEMMKLVTVAYENKDLMQLLQLQIVWITKHDDHFNNLDATTLNAYIHLLIDQAKELEMELQMLYMNPAYSAIFSFGRQDLKSASREIKYEGFAYKEMNAKLKADIQQLEMGKRTNATVVRCIREYYEDSIDEFIKRV
ncbi:hypothetical protein A4H97_25425 [Niastella yeongjuensis]|uniref:J domain-containing protein n=1 Tax=Niastella yeongjuensis TaxID=354355 RepID=A0A1V9F155_9BACT|nr:hypothetical protein [Niastella yeongjuensis]OQP51966.1 hypothetical protein A4H97_25425 [Niastella yeongjuensis]SEP35817.1 hypothetical protein SAMN05660816_05428 [Niastella yeongjuensis]